MGGRERNEGNYPYNYTETATVVMLASYESSNHCAGVVTCLCLIAVGMDIHLGGRDLSCDDPDPGFLQTSGFSTGFANGY